MMNANLLDRPVGDNIGIDSRGTMYFWEPRFITTAFNSGIRQRVDLSNVGELNDRGAQIDRETANLFKESLDAIVGQRVDRYRPSKRRTGQRTLLAGFRLLSCYCDITDKGSHYRVDLSRTYMEVMLKPDPEVRGSNSIGPIQKDLIAMILEASKTLDASTPDSVNPAEAVNPAAWEIREKMKRGKHTVLKGFGVRRDLLIYFLLAFGELCRDARVINLTYKERESEHGARVVCRDSDVEMLGHDRKYLYMDGRKMVYGEERGRGVLVDLKTGALFIEYDRHKGQALFCLLRPCYGVVPYKRTGVPLVKPMSEKQKEDTWMCHKWLEEMKAINPKRVRAL